MNSKDRTNTTTTPAFPFTLTPRMRPPPNSIHEYLYRLLIDSPGFNNWVRRIHARINRIPLNQVFPENVKYSKEFDIHDYKPTAGQKLNAFRKIWAREMKQTFKFW